MRVSLLIFGIFVCFVGMNWYNKTSAKRVEIAGLCTMVLGVTVATLAVLA